MELDVCLNALLFFETAAQFLMAAASDCASIPKAFHLRNSYTEKKLECCYLWWRVVNSKLLNHFTVLRGQKVLHDYAAIRNVISICCVTPKSSWECWIVLLMPLRPMVTFIISSSLFKAWLVNWWLHAICDAEACTRNNNSVEW